MRGAPIPKLIAAVIVLTVVTSVIMLIPNWDGEQASTAAHKIDRLLDVMIVLSSFVFSLVMVMLGYALYKFRAKPGDESDGEPIHGNTRLEIAWTVIPTVIVLFGAGYSWAVLDNIENRSDDAMTVNVYSQQFVWSFGYADNQKWSQGELHVPLDRQVIFRMHAQDVIHSFWVPEWRIKKDNVPGITTQAVITPDRLGTYQLICTELCGFGHSTMRATVVVEPKAQFRKWLAGIKTPVPQVLIEGDSSKLEPQTSPPEASGSSESTSPAPTAGGT
jgi:cytochrome c oxidase subunit 2